MSDKVIGYLNLIRGNAAILTCLQDDLDRTGNIILKACDRIEENISASHIFSTAEYELPITKDTMLECIEAFLNEALGYRVNISKEGIS